MSIDEVMGKGDGIWTDGEEEGDCDDSTPGESRALASPAAQQSYIKKSIYYGENHWLTVCDILTQSTVKHN